MNVGSSISLNADVDSYGSGTDPQFKLGTIVNNDNDANVEYIVIEFNALVLNRSSNQQNTLLRNDFQVSINPTDLPGRPTLRTSNQANVRVVEPRIDDLAISVSQPNADAGDTVTFSVTFSNDNNNNRADAFNARLTDLLPAGYALNAGSVSISTSGGFGPITNNTAGNEVDISFDQIPKGGSVTVTFTATLGIAIQPGEVLSTPATITYSSLPGSGTAGNLTGSDTPGVSGTSTGERTGAGGVNDHRDTDSVALTVFSPSLTKSLVATSIVNANNAVDETVIGELATYELVLVIPEGTMNLAEVVDNLEPGLVFERIDSVSYDADIATDLVGPVTANVSGQAVRFDLGNLVNSADDAAAETITIRYTVRVDNAVGNQGELAGMVLSNAACDLGSQWRNSNDGDGRGRCHRDRAGFGDGLHRVAEFR